MTVCMTTGLCKRLWVFREALYKIEGYYYNKAVDLHELELGVWYLHAIDHFTHFSAGSIVTTKKPGNPEMNEQPWGGRSWRSLDGRGGRANPVLLLRL